MRYRAAIVPVMMVLLAACGDSGGEPTTVPAPPATVASTTATSTTSTTAPAPPPATMPTPPTVVPETTPTMPGPDFVIGEPDANGIREVTVNTDALAPLFDSFTPGDDPFYLIHTQQDDLFIGIELYTVFGDRWTGELGTFPADCLTHGICVYLDPDGGGPLIGGGPGTGQVSVVQLEGGTIVTIDDITITTESGEIYHMAGITLAG